MRMVMLNELMGWDGFFATMPYGDYWRTHRRLFTRHFDVDPTMNHHPMQTRAVHALLQDLLDAPNLWADHLSLATGKLLMDATYGIDVKSKDDKYITAPEESIKGLVKALTPGTFLAEGFPILKHIPSWVPGAGFQKFALKEKAIATRVFDDPFAALKKDIAEEAARPSFGLRCLQEVDSSRDAAYQNRVIRNATGSVYFAGTNTTVSALSTFILAMVLYPEAQAKARAEIDSVLGEGQLPTFADESSLPYLSAVVSEVLRWEVVAPFAIPHLSTEEDNYNSYTIPKGTLVIPNTWAVLNDEKTYPNPSKFNPERFLKDGNYDSLVQDPMAAAFGYGRRICPARHFAREFLWFSAGSILAAFNIDALLDARGERVLPRKDYGSGGTRTPKPFECMITPRSATIVDAIQGLSNNP
ncbi:cytochrome P450 [Athelia psychrophila]|uniref:Cytochrome P450 n=1 Tax=Athelia psychrophila TaxID=1759441 RepID=A0A167X3C3_9AGAM|nr:cytochrome P450 [Fibularhizoctonia sp. CBS 109695]